MYIFGKIQKHKMLNFWQNRESERLKQKLRPK